MRQHSIRLWVWDTFSHDTYPNKKIALTHKPSPHALLLRFDSQTEYRRWLELRLLLRTGHIFNLAVHPVFLLGAYVKRTWEADFSYIETDTPKIIVEDVKGYNAKTDKYIVQPATAVLHEWFAERYHETHLLRITTA